VIERCRQPVIQAFRDAGLQFAQIVTVMEFGKGEFEVKATTGNTQLGGTDMDRILVEHLVQVFRSKSGIDLRNDRGAMARLREAAEIAKIELSNNEDGADQPALPLGHRGGAGPPRLRIHSL
jgi:Hsp70 protein